MKNDIIEDMVEIILTTYNGDNYLKELLESIISQTHNNIRLSVYDDGSTDKTMDILKEYEYNYFGIIKIHKNTVNMGSARNFLKGAKNAKAPYIMFCDQDDVWQEDKVEKTYKMMKQMEKVNKNIPLLVFTDAIVTDKDLNKIHSSFHELGKLNPYKTSLSYLLMENKIIGCTTMFNKSLIQMLNKLPKHSKHHDWWIALLAASFGKIGYIKTPTLYYRQHEKNVVGTKGFIPYIINRLSSLKKQALSLRVLERQAQEFYSIYKDRLSDENKDIIYRFATLSKQNWFCRRYLIVKDKYLKTGIIRNIGVLFLI